MLFFILTRSLNTSNAHKHIPIHISNYRELEEHFTCWPALSYCVQIAQHVIESAHTTQGEKKRVLVVRLPGHTDTKIINFTHGPTNNKHLKSGWWYVKRFICVVSDILASCRILRSVMSFIQRLGYYLLILISN